MSKHQQRATVEAPLVPRRANETDGLFVGHSIKGFTIVRPLGSGGQGEVWLAERFAGGSRVAIKLLRHLPGKNSHVRARFEQSIEVLKRLNHPAIARSIDFGELANGRLWHAVEYVEGKTLLEFVDQLDTQFRHERGRESRLPIESIIKLFILVCEAVEAAHQVGVIHRDLKPSNIIVDKQGRPYLLDFGHATAAGLESAEALTLTGEFLGTPAYASPEQVLCSPGTTDVRTDVYSIGIMLYQCLTGAFPYQVDGPLARTFEQIQYVEPTPPRSHVPWISRDLQAIVLRALAKRREERYQSVGELRADLERFLNGEAVTARGPGLVYHALKFFRRHRVLSTAGALVAILTVVYSVSMTALYRRATNAEALAVRHADEAQAKFSIARETLDFVVTQIESRLNRISGTRELREDLLRDAYSKLSVLTDSNSDDPALRAELAAVHRRLGSIAKDLYQDEDAARHWRASLAIMETLVAEHPDNAAYLESLSISHVLMGDIAKGACRWDETRDRYRNALAIDERLVADHPENDNYLDNLAWSYERMAGTLWCADPLARRDYHRKRHDIALRLVARDPDNRVRLNNLCTSHIFQARHFGDGDRAAFLNHAKQAAELADRIVAPEPLNGQFVFTAVSAAFLQLDELLRVGQVAAALAILDRIIQMADAIHQRDPDGHWGRVLKARAEDARALVRRLQEITDPVGRDLRALLPRYEDV